MKQRELKKQKNEQRIVAHRTDFLELHMAKIKKLLVKPRFIFDL
jgi:hypothetical protein